MAKITGELRVHLDHLIRRQSIRYTPEKEISSDHNSYRSPSRKKDNELRYDDIRRDEWFSMVRKPDFQRETNAWTPEDCLAFLDSVVNGRIIPSIILWRNQENNFTYVLDGSHRLSVLRAWMMDDWGDCAENDYYARRDENLVKEAATQTRDLIRQEIGSFAEFEVAWQKYRKVSGEGGAPKLKLSERQFMQASFYSDIVGSHNALAVQWEQGNYKSAEQSFLRINRSGQALDPWEATLIEYRQSSYARSIMCIANGGESGHYWPELPDKSNCQLADMINSFSSKAAKVHKILFVPPFQLPITTLNVPLMVAPAYFQKHKYLLEIIPILVDQQIASGDDEQIKIMREDVNAPAETIIKNANRILTAVEQNLEHFLSPSHSSKSLSLVPLFYWYNRQAHYARGLFYGFVYWLLSGSDEVITARKLVLSTNRDRFEYILFHLKSDIATLQEKGGAGLNATKRVAKFFQSFLELLHSKPDLLAESEELEEEVVAILQEMARLPSRKSRKAKSSRSHSKSDKSQINIRELFAHSIRCHICGGVVNLQHGGLQYDHVNDYAFSQVTDPETGKPTHPFCNRYKKEIQAYRNGQKKISLPPFTVDLAKKRKKKEPSPQLAFDFWGKDEFPS